MSELLQLNPPVQTQVQASEEETVDLNSMIPDISTVTAPTQAVTPPRRNEPRTRIRCACGSPDCRWFTVNPEWAVLAYDE